MQGISWEQQAINTNCYSDDLKGRVHLENSDVKTKLKHTSKKSGMKLLNGFIWLGIGTSNMLL